MKAYTYIFIFLFVVCCFDASAQSNASAKTPSTVKNKKDKQGRKQGVWDVKQNGYLKGYETYLNDTLHGKFNHWINYEGQIIKGQYTHGLEDGLWKSYENKTDLVMVVKYKQGKELWMGFPLADTAYSTPMKGFAVYSDSILIECPYDNGKIWYRGLYINKKPVGIHYMYYPNGKLRYEHDYATARIKVYDKNGKFLLEKDDDIGKTYH